MNESNPSVERADATSLERRVNRLATERTLLFDRAGIGFGLSQQEQERLRSVERELDECFLERRRMRAASDARRFDPYAAVARTTRRRETS
ncbi:MAG TPA: DUF2630 domain-containing protein [Acidimicrobiia bacterium]|nr:DUF2630 domain-containing protein [Acidimicrobiia bacterium]